MSGFELGGPVFVFSVRKGGDSECTEHTFLYIFVWSAEFHDLCPLSLLKPSGNLIHMSETASGDAQYDRASTV